MIRETGWYEVQWLHASQSMIALWNSDEGEWSIIGSHIKRIDSEIGIVIRRIYLTGEIASNCESVPIDPVIAIKVNDILNERGIYPKDLKRYDSEKDAANTGKMTFNNYWVVSDEAILDWIYKYTDPIKDKDLIEFFESKCRPKS